MGVSNLLTYAVHLLSTRPDYSADGVVPAKIFPDPKSAIGTGYGESKWVAEHVLQNVMQQTDMHAIIVRLGQVASDRLGYWNEKEWFPALVKTALHQRCLPDIDGVMSLSVLSVPSCLRTGLADRFLVPVVRGGQGIH